MKITIDQIMKLLVALGYVDSTLRTVVEPWLVEPVEIRAHDVRFSTTRWEYFQICNHTICNSVVASSAIEGEEVVCSELANLVHFIDFAIRRKFQVKQAP